MVIINSFRYPESTVRHEQREIRAILDKKDLGLGTLFVSESTLCWQEKDNIGFSIGYSDITLHAISKDQTLYPRECLFIVVDGKLSMPGDEPNNEELNEDSESSGDEQDNEVSELLLVPPVEDVNAVKNIYEALKICQELNPDPDDMDDDDDNLYADAEDIEEEEGHYLVERGAGDADIDDISRRMEDNSVNVGYANGTHNAEDEEFEDAD